MSMISGQFQRTEMLLGEAAFQRIQKSHVTVVGLGAVGYSAAEAMVRYGLGAIRLVDFDIIRPANINRQLLALASTLGQTKVSAAQNRLLDINPDLVIERYETFFHEETFSEIFKTPTDMVVDAIDSFTPKVILLEMLNKHGIAVISSMGAAQRTDPFAIRVGDISETQVCPLAGRIRKQLRKVGVHKGFRCVYSVEPVVRPRISSSPGESNENQSGSDYEKEFMERGRRRQPVGSISYMTGIFGYIIAAEVLQTIVKGIK